MSNYIDTCKKCKARQNGYLYYFAGIWFFLCDTCAGVKTLR
jgi:hypothetical protein